jgi:hypothetical protein
MLLSIATTHAPATDLGFLLMKHPDRLHDVELSFGRAFVFFPKPRDERCEAVPVLDVDPVAPLRGRGASDGLIDHYVNDRPYAASSFLQAWALGIKQRYGYEATLSGIGEAHPELGAASQLAVFRR